MKGKEHHPLVVELPYSYSTLLSSFVCVVGVCWCLVCVVGVGVVGVGVVSSSSSGDSIENRRCPPRKPAAWRACASSTPAG